MVEQKTILIACLALGVALAATLAAGLANLVKVSAGVNGSSADKSAIPSWGTVEASKLIDGFALAGAVILSGGVAYLLFGKSQ